MANEKLVLTYATPVPRVAVHLVVILYLWAVVDMMGGLFLIMTALLAVSSGMGPLEIVGLCLLVFGPGLFVWGFLVFRLAHRMLRREVPALRRAASMAIGAEILAWTLAALLGFEFLRAAALKRDGPDMLIFVVGIAVAVTVTRILLRRAVRRVSR